MTQPETMTAFFAARVRDYDDHMLNGVEGCREGYAEMARRIPVDARDLLDLGCGTGLELCEIFRHLPQIRVTGIDMTQEMLDALRKKYPARDLTLICGDYFAVDFGRACFDCAVSFETMHHFPPERKIGLYKRIFDALRPGGCYIECDYMVETQAEEDHHFTQSAHLRQEAGIPDDALYHLDTPCTVENQIRMLQAAGFTGAEHVFRIGGTSMITACKLIDFIQMPNAT